MISDREGRRAEYKTFRENFLQPENILTVEKLSDYEAVMKRWKNKEITAVVAMRLTGLKRTKFYELAKEWEGKS